ncbi:TPA: hypothetical protein I8Y21_004533 [Klebsiella oxytoca]|uniref:Uncharacterized protein n=1 Tax=Klebsiella oxytoca TaxID=571 RepID=A0AAN5RFK9_KLEOX|nr:hypothetical protein [Klebsiella oxytoca]
MADIMLPVIPPILRSTRDLHNLTRVIGQVCREGCAVSARDVVPDYFWCICTRSPFIGVHRYDETRFTWYSLDREALKNWFGNHWYPLQAAAVSGDDRAYVAAEFRLAIEHSAQWALLQAAWMMPDNDGGASDKAWGYARTMLGELGCLSRFREATASGSGTPVTLTSDIRRVESTLAVAACEPENAAAAQQAWCEQMFVDGLLSANESGLPAGWPQALVNRLAPVIIALARLPASGIITTRSLPEFQSAPELHPCARCEHQDQIPDGHRPHPVFESGCGRCGSGCGAVFSPGTGAAVQVYSSPVSQTSPALSGHPDAGEAVDA